MSDVAGRSRVERLQALTAALSRAPTVKAVTGVVMTAITDELGAGAALVALLDGDEPATFNVVDAVGYLPGTVAQWRSFPLDAPLPAGDALRSGSMVVLESLADRDERYPLLRGAPASHEAWAIVPLMVDGGPLGIISFGFDGARRLGKADRTFVQAVADQCAQALHRARLYDGQRAVARQRGFLNQAGEAFAAASSYEDVLQLVVDLATPALGDAAALYVGVPGGLRLATSRSAGPEGQQILDHLGPRAMFSDNALLRQVFRSGEPGLQVRESTDGGVPPGLLLALPLRSRTTEIGVLVLVACDDRRFTPSEWSFAESYCSLAALHCDNARLLEEQTRIAQRLQSSLLPPMLPQVPGVELAAIYVAAGSGAEVGGDFYDVFAAGDGRWFALTGDVRGRGVDAAVTTGLARHTIRAAALPGAEPSAVVRRLNDVLLAREPTGWEPRFCAVCVIAVTLAEDGVSATMCCAGHPLPWLVGVDGSVREVGRPGTVAGVVADAVIVDTTVPLRPGDTLVAFTDGVTERRRDGAFFEDHVPDVLAASARLEVSALAEELRDRAVAFAPGEANDDMAVLVLRVAAPGAPTRSG